MNKPNRLNKKIEGYSHLYSEVVYDGKVCSLSSLSEQQQESAEKICEIGQINRNGERILLVQIPSFGDRDGSYEQWQNFIENFDKIYDKNGKDQDKDGENIECIGHKPDIYCPSANALNEALTNPLAPFQHKLNEPVPNKAKTPAPNGINPYDPKEPEKRKSYSARYVELELELERIEFENINASPRTLLKTLAELSLTHSSKAKNKKVNRPIIYRKTTGQSQHL